MIRNLGTCAYGPRFRNNIPSKKASLAFGDIHKDATSEFMGTSHRRLKSFANDFGFKQIGTAHPSRRLFQTSCARSPSSDGNRAAVKGLERLGSQTIPATVSEAPYILDCLLMNEAGRQVGEQYADTTGFTDNLFGTSAMLGYRLVLRIRYLPSKRLYVFNPAATPKDLRGLVGGKIREELIVANWPDLFRCAATMATGKIKPSQLLRKLAAYPCQNDLATALREIGRVERTLFIMEWILDADMQRRAQIGLNKGEAHHALKNALRIGRQGKIRDRTTEGQHYRIAGLNLLTAIITYWNTVHLGHAIEDRQNEGLDVPPELLAHISPPGWAHILLTGEYLWPMGEKA